MSCWEIFGCGIFVGVFIGIWIAYILTIVKKEK